MTPPSRNPVDLSDMGDHGNSADGHRFVAIVLAVVHWGAAGALLWLLFYLTFPWENCGDPCERRDRVLDGAFGAAVPWLTWAAIIIALVTGGAALLARRPVRAVAIGSGLAAIAWAAVVLPLLTA